MIPWPALSLKGWLAIGGSVAMIAGGAWIWRIDTLRAEHLAALGQCQSEKSEQAEAFRRAQRVAQDLAEAAKARKDAENEAARQQADARYDDLGSRYRALVLRKAAADRRAAGGADLPGADEAAESPDGPGESAGVPIGTFVITESDALICADNSARLEVARQWAIETGH